MKGRLDLKVSDLGLTQLKNIAEPVRVYTLEVGAQAHAKFATPSGTAEPSAARAPRKRSGLALSALAIALLLAAGAAAWHFVGANRSAAIASTPSAEAAHLSIVVLPFTNLSGDPSQDYFADGITENLTTDLSRLSGSFVIARNTAFTFKGKNADARDIGKELGVRYVLEGSVQRDQNQVRVNAQLIDAKSGGHLWAERFDKPLVQPLQHAGRHRRQSRQPIGGRVDHQRGSPRGADAKSGIPWISIFREWRGSTRGEIPPISPARAISLSVHWRLIPTISTQSSEGRVLMLRRLQAITWTTRPNASGQLRRT